MLSLSDLINKIIKFEKLAQLAFKTGFAAEQTLSSYFKQQKNVFIKYIDSIRNKYAISADFYNQPVILAIDIKQNYLKFNDIIPLNTNEKVFCVAMNQYLHSLESLLLNILKTYKVNPINSGKIFYRIYFQTGEVQVVDQAHLTGRA